MSRLNTLLSGVRVLDVSAYIPGPLTSLIFADMGADVIKVEPPTGDGMRSLGPLDPDGTPVFHQVINAGKRICRLDLKSAEGVTRFLALARQADVLIEGFRPGAMERLGLGHARLRQRHPGLIYCSISGYGQQGPLARDAGHDANYVAASGMLDRNGNPPRVFEPPLSDLGGALFAAVTILAALRRRDADGEGLFIDIALADTPMLLQQFALAEFGMTGMAPKSDRSYLNGGAAYYRIYRTRDARYVALAAIEVKFWRAFCAAAGRPDWIDRQRDPLPQADLIDELVAYFATVATSECVSLFGKDECCLSLVNDLDEAIHSTHHTARGLLRRGADGYLQALFPACIDGAAPAVRRPALAVDHAAFALRDEDTRSNV